jgi:hypothetical protein
MTMYSTEVQQFGLKLEAVRATAESAPAKWYPTRGPVELNYGLAHLADEGLRGRASRYAPIAGIKTGEGKIPMILDPNMCGEIFYGVLGGKSTAQQASTAAYKHSFTPGTSIQKPAYTLFADRSLNVLKYNLGIFKKITLKGGVDNLIELDADVLFKAEASGSMGSPSYPTQRYFSFQNVDFKLAGSSNTDVKEWSLNDRQRREGFPNADRIPGRRRYRFAGPADDRRRVYDLLLVGDRARQIHREHLRRAPNPDGRRRTSNRPITTRST